MRGVPARLAVCVAVAVALLCGGNSGAPAAERPRERRARLGERRAAAAEAWVDDPAGASRVVLPVGARLMRDLAYGPDPRHRMDVYLPARPAGAPVLFMVHGGAWRTGDKGLQRVVDNKVARWLPLGFVFVSVNYRLLPTDPVAQKEDVARALAFAQGQAESWGADPAGFVLMGHSAGAHLVSLLNSAPESARRLGASSWLGAVALDSAVMNVPAVMEAAHSRFHDAAFGADPTFWRAASPFHQLSEGAPPMLAVCSTRRPDEPCAASRAYAARANAMGLRVEVLEQPATHAEINGELGRPGAYTQAVERFLASLSPAVAQRLVAPGAVRSWPVPPGAAASIPDTPPSVGPRRIGSTVTAPRGRRRTMSLDSCLRGNSVTR
jgi:acetyl esterase/lipase